MKKFIASILAVCMVLTSMFFTVSAAVEVKTDRALTVVVDKTEVYAINGKDIVTVKVVVADNRQNVTTDDQFTVAEYTLDYDPALFTLQETNLENHDAVNGTIKETFYVETIAGWTTGAELATYTFKAKPQVDVETDTFDLVSPQLYTVRESLKGDIFEAKSESKDVTILLEPYKVTKYIDGNEVNDSADDTLPDNSFPYDNNPHSFKVETVPDATVSYEVKYTAPDGTVTTSSDVNNIKAEGTYEISYEVTNKANGYAPVKGTYTIEIQEPVHVIEVIEDYILAESIGKNLVLVYTNTEGAVYKYNGEVMVDVSKSGYQYNNTDPSHKFVYAFVAEPITKDNGSTVETDFDAHKALVSHVYNYSGDIPEVGEYNTDVNFIGGLGIQDIAVVWGAINGHPVYFEDVAYQRYLLKADVSKNKQLRGNDASFVVNDVKAAKN